MLASYQLIVDKRGFYTPSDKCPPLLKNANTSGQPQTRANTSVHETASIITTSLNIFIYIQGL